MSELPTRRRKFVSRPTAALAPSTVRPHVLLGAPDDDARDACEEQLRAAGCRVSVARTAFETIVKACCLVPDLILLVTASGKEAVETGALITSCPVTAHIPVVRVPPGRAVSRRVLSDLRRAAS